MPTLIDGHNLIPKLGLRLDSIDDEMELVSLLQSWCRLARREVEVYFDNAPPGQPKTRKFGMVNAHFVQKPSIADEAIRLRLKKLGREAKNWTVVSSDLRVQAEARSAGAQATSSEEFARQVHERLNATSGEAAGEKKISTQEVDEWLELFERRQKKY
jgi:predicted RNA-binding protein with PIN domain